MINRIRSMASVLSKTDMVSKLSSRIGWVSKHNLAMGAGVGAVGGFIGSGGSLGGAIGGALTGAIGAHSRGWGSYKGTKGGRGSSYGRKVVGKLGKLYSKGPMGEIAQAIGPQGGSIGHARNVGGKMMATAAIAPWQMGGAGAIGGMAYSLGKSTIGGLGSSFGSEKRSHYGTNFSGMGNGSTRGY